MRASIAVSIAASSSLRRASWTPISAVQNASASGELASAVDRPRNKWAYEGADLAALAAAYAFGIAKNHPFVEGNKRAALLAMVVFLRKNAVPFSPSEADATAAMRLLAAGEIDEEGLARWIRDNWPLPG